MKTKWCSGCFRDMRSVSHVNRPIPSVILAMASVPPYLFMLINEVTTATHKKITILQF
jgi:hypothetical protein